MKNKAQELEVRNIMQGLEEFANFISFRASNSGLRILSVETVEQNSHREQMVASSVDIVDLQQHTKKKQSARQQIINKSLSFVDRQVH